jgi:hypothetical protein
MRQHECDEMTLGPRTQIAFKSNPLALPKRTCLVAFGPLWLVVRVEEIADDGTAHGVVLGRRKRATEKKARGQLRASDLIDAGMRDIARG